MSMNDVQENSSNKQRRKNTRVAHIYSHLENNTQTLHRNPVRGKSPKISIEEKSTNTTQ
jgi:hypothetical protein